MGTLKIGNKNVLDNLGEKKKGGRPKGSKQKFTNKTLQNWEWAAKQAGAERFDRIKKIAKGEKKLFIDWLDKSPTDFTREYIKRRVSKPAEIQQDIRMIVKWSDSDTKYGSGPI